MKISVVTTLFNYKSYIVDCIKSVVTQDFYDLEMIVVDDGSTDGGPECVERKFAEDSRVKLVRLNKNYGYSVAKNVGISMSSGSFICMLDADDMLMPSSLSKRYNKILEGFDLVHGWAYNFHKNKRWENDLRKKWIENKKPVFQWKNIHPQCVLLKKDLHNSIGLYDEDLKCKSDREMWARIFNHGFKIGFIDEPVALYRQHPSQMHKSPWKIKNNKRLASELLSLVEIRKSDISECQMLSNYNWKDKILSKQKLNNSEAEPMARENPALLYGEDFFSKRTSNKHDWGLEMGKYLSMKLNLSSVIDWGCGIGSLISGAKLQGVEKLLGVEVGYDAAKPYLVENVKDNIVYGNAAHKCDFGKFDAAVSIEVAEHLLPEQADVFCDNLANSSSRIIVITAARPGQEGVYHFNCQPKEYWINKIQKLGFTYRQDLSDKISKGWRENVPGIPSYLTQNVMVFKIDSKCPDDIKKKNIHIGKSADIIKVSFDLPDNDSSGKHKFFQRVRENLHFFNCKPVGSAEKSDIHFYINNPSKKSVVNIKRLDGVYFDGTNSTKVKNSGILNSMKIADGIVFQSQYCKDYGCKILNFNSHKPNAVIYNGCDPSEFTVAPKEIGCPYFLALCKWRRHKRLRESVDGFIKANIDGVKLVVCGPPDYRVDHPGVIYAGDLNRSDLARYIAGCIGTVHLAWIDWCPNSVVESIVAGKQVIHTNSGGTSEIVKNRGYMVSDTVWHGEQASPKNPPQINLDEIALAYIKSYRNPIINFNYNDLLISNSVKQYIEFGISVLRSKK
jgi:glycosyltransferase involved in cell wall biosynthesis